MNRHEDCKACGLYKHSKQMVFGVGPKDARLMLVGEAPGAEEDEEGEPFVGRAGGVLTRAFSAIGRSRDEVYITNVCKCRPPRNRTPTAEEADACLPWLQAEVDAIKPKVILCLGKTSSVTVLNESDSVTIKRLRAEGPVWSDEFRCHVVTTYHPAALLRQGERNDWSAALREDLKLAFELSERESDVKDVNHVVVKTLKEAEYWYKRLRKRRFLSFDIETTGLDPFAPDARVRCIGFCGKAGEAVCFPMDTFRPGELLPGAWSRTELQIIRRYVAKLLTGKSKLIAHNAAFDMKYLLQVEGIDASENVVFDTMLAYYLIDEEASHALASLAAKFTPFGGYEEDSADYGGPHLAPDEVVFEKNCIDVDVTFRIYRTLRDQLYHERLFFPFFKLLMPALPVLMRMELRGVLLNVAHLHKCRTRFTKASDRLNADAEELPSVRRYMKKNGKATFNLNSSRQVKATLHSLGCHVESTKASSLEDVVKQCRGQEAATLSAMVLKYRGYSKLIGTYVDGLLAVRDSNNLVHTNFNLHITKTGRLSSDSPNLQNIPARTADGREIRKAFIPRPGNVFVEVDGSQMELRVLAMYCHDANLIRTFHEGLDIHRVSAAEAFEVDYEDVTPEQRKQAKGGVSFGILYGRGPSALAKEYNWPVWRAQEFIDRWYEGFPDIMPWKDRLIRGVKRRGYLRTYFGRKRRALYIDDHVERSLINDPVQATASDICLWALIWLDKKLAETGLGHLVLTVHDSILVECAEEDVDEVVRLCRRAMEEVPFDFVNVPLVAEASVGRNWGAMEEVAA